MARPIRDENPHPIKSVTELLVSFIIDKFNLFIRCCKDKQNN